MRSRVAGEWLVSGDLFLISCPPSEPYRNGIVVLAPKEHHHHHVAGWLPVRPLRKRSKKVE